MSALLHTSTMVEILPFISIAVLCLCTIGFIGIWIINARDIAQSDAPVYQDTRQLMSYRWPAFDNHVLIPWAPSASFYDFLTGRLDSHNFNIPLATPLMIHSPSLPMYHFSQSDMYAAQRTESLRRAHGPAPNYVQSFSRNFQSEERPITTQIEDISMPLYHVIPVDINIPIEDGTISVKEIIIPVEDSIILVEEIIVPDEIHPTWNPATGIFRWP
ncbi:uncharacterized protein N7511_000376 [Penicillium nucicola]|uniref:uncharacterized protein n=1 Tax=Penicillium nucicola TaxID=1850975 RepID=UPI002545A6A9|nr:uncharacterized protein N7511_000376 [Penicillium nucicola]KAJ5775365.1 hypothetical protein N7511_000376 [Penicillium nucicola]